MRSPVHARMHPALGDLFPSPLASSDKHLKSLRPIPALEGKCSRQSRDGDGDGGRSACRRCVRCFPALMRGRRRGTGNGCLDRMTVMWSPVRRAAGNGVWVEVVRRGAWSRPRLSRGCESPTATIASTLWRSCVITNRARLDWQRDCMSLLNGVVERSHHTGNFPAPLHRGESGNTPSQANTDINNRAARQQSPSQRLPSLPRRTTNHADRASREIRRPASEITPRPAANRVAAPPSATRGNVG